MHAILRPSFVLLVAVVLAVALFAASQGTDSAQSGPQAEMALVVNPDGAACTEVCTIPLNGTFTLAVDIVTAPESGYVAVQTLIDYGDELIYDFDALAAVDEIVWSDLEGLTSIKASTGSGLVVHSGLSTIFPVSPPSRDTGNFVEIVLTCSADDTSTKIDLLPRGYSEASNSGTAFSPPAGEPFAPIVGSVQVDCRAGGPLDTQTPTATQRPLPTTPTPTPTSGPQVEMGLVVNPDGAACSTVCSIPLNGMFTLAVDIVTAPASGYVAAQTFIDYDDNLFYDIDARPAETEIVWHDLAPITAVKASMGLGLVVHAGVTGFAPPLPVSTYTGTFLEIELACSPDDTSTKIDLLPHGDPQTLTSGTAFLFDPGTGRSADRQLIVPIVDSIQVDCGAGGPLDTPTPIQPPTETPTPWPTLTRPTTRPSVPVTDETPTMVPPSGGTGPTATPGGPLIPGDGLFLPDDSLLFDDATTVATVTCRVPVSASDAVAILRWHAGLTGGVPCVPALDVTRDSVIDSRDAAVVMQFAAGLLATLPP